MQLLHKFIVQITLQIPKRHFVTAFQSRSAPPPTRMTTTTAPATKRNWIASTPASSQQPHHTALHSAAHIHTHGDAFLRTYRRNISYFPVYHPRLPHIAGFDTSLSSANAPPTPPTCDCYLTTPVFTPRNLWRRKIHVRSRSRGAPQATYFLPVLRTNTGCSCHW